MPVQPNLPDLPSTLANAVEPDQITPGYGNTTIAFPEAIGESFEAASPDAVRLPTSGEIAVDMGSIAHGLTYPLFDVNGNIAQDLESVSSPLARTKKEEADRMVEAIQEQRQTVRVIKENIQLNDDIVKAGIVQENFLGSVIDYGTAQVKKQEKFVKYQSAGVSLATAEFKLSQAEEKLYQEQISLTGIEEMTPLLKQEWTQKKALKVSKIQDLQNALFQSASNLDQDLRVDLDGASLGLMGGGNS